MRTRVEGGREQVRQGRSLEDEVAPRLPRARVKVEAFTWSILTRVLLATLSLERTLQTLDALPHRRRTTSGINPPDEGPFWLAGACLGKAIARSQYLRVRGHANAVVIGVQGGTGTFAAHAWLEPYDNPSNQFHEIRRFVR